MLTDKIYNSFEILLPRYCLVCNIRLRKRTLCFRCAPEPDVVAHGSGSRCNQCFSEVFELDPDGLCHLCRVTPPLFKQIRYLWGYERRYRDLITVMKYRPSVKLCQILGGSMFSQMNLLFTAQEWDLIVPMCASDRALRQRGFNQCQIIASVLSRDSKVRLDGLALRHKGYKNFQAALKPNERMTNVKYSIGADPKRVNQKRILLVEDVVTTGATSNAAALALLEAGAIEVNLISLARSQGWNTFRAEIHRRFRV